jgi:hypothetical protein
VGSVWRQLAAAASAGLFVVLAYAAFAGDFAEVRFRGGAFGTAAIGRLLVAHDGLATAAVAAVVLVSLIGATAAWRARERGR